MGLCKFADVAFILVVFYYFAICFLNTVLSTDMQFRQFFTINWEAAIIQRIIVYFHRLWITFSQTVTPVYIKSVSRHTLIFSIGNKQNRYCHQKQKQKTKDKKQLIAVKVFDSHQKFQVSRFYAISNGRKYIRIQARFSPTIS